MTDQDQPEKGLSDEFQKLGSNIKEMAQAALGSGEFKKFQNELNEGINELGESISKFFKEVADSPAGTRVKEEIDDISRSVRSGELESKVRQDVLAALRKANDELEKAAQRWRADEDTATPGSTTESTEENQSQ